MKFNPDFQVPESDKQVIECLKGYDNNTRQLLTSLYKCNRKLGLDIRSAWVDVVLKQLRYESFLTKES